MNSELEELATKWERAVEYMRENTEEYANETATLAGADALEDCADQLRDTMTQDNKMTGPDQYAAICKAMEPGLLIAVNNDDSAMEAPSDELRVTSAGDPAILRGSNGEVYHLGTNRAGDTVLAEVDLDGSARETDVETIEILGIEEPHNPK